MMLYTAPDKVSEFISQRIMSDLMLLNFLSYNDLMNLPVLTVNHMREMKAKLAEKDPLGGLGGLGGALQNLLGARR